MEFIFLLLLLWGGNIREEEEKNKFLSAMYHKVVKLQVHTKGEEEEKKKSRIT